MDTTKVPYIYGLYDPQDRGHVRYVGLALINAARPFQHANIACTKSAPDSHKIRWIRKLQSEGRSYEFMILEELPLLVSSGLAHFVENSYIKSLRAIGHNLTNVTTDGGGAFLGPHTTESRAKMSAKLKGKIPSQEVKEKRATALRKFHAENPGIVVITEEHRAKIAKTLTGFKHTPEARANMGASHVGTKRTEEQRANIGASLVGKPKSEECKKKIAATLTGRKASDETRAKQSVGIKAAKNTPEAKLAASIKGKAVWAKRKAAKEVCH